MSIAFYDYIYIFIVIANKETIILSFNPNTANLIRKNGWLNDSFKNPIPFVYNETLFVIGNCLDKQQVYTYNYVMDNWTVHVR